MTIPVTQEATVVKNPDGTYSVRVQHTEGGDISEVHFPHLVFAKQMAEGYAALINGYEKLDGMAKQELEGSGITEEKLQADAKAILASVEAEVTAMKQEAENLLADAKTEALKLIADAKAEAAKLIAAAKAEVAKSKTATAVVETAQKVVTKVKDELEEL